MIWDAGLHHTFFFFVLEKGVIYFSVVLGLFSPPVNLPAPHLQHPPAPGFRLYPACAAGSHQNGFGCSGRIEGFYKCKICFLVEKNNNAAENSGSIKSRRVVKRFPEIIKKNTSPGMVF